MGKRNVKVVVLNTNVITRYLVGDIPAQLEKITTLFDKAERGDIKLLMLPVVIAEVSYVLQTAYHRSEQEISEVIQDLLIQPWLELEHKNALLGLWGWYENGQHFVDSYLLALEKYEGVGIASFDKELNKKLGSKIFTMEKKG